MPKALNSSTQAIAAAKSAAPVAGRKPATKDGAKAKKLSGREQKELETLPAKIEALEQEQAQLTAKLADPAFYKKEPQKFAEVKGRLDALEREHATAFARWEELEAVKNAAG